jgi:hypothetical protein
VETAMLAAVSGLAYLVSTILKIENTVSAELFIDGLSQHFSVFRLNYIETNNLLLMIICIAAAIMTPLSIIHHQ